MRLQSFLLAISFLASLVALTACDDSDPGGGGGSEPVNLPEAACRIWEGGAQPIEAKESGPLAVVGVGETAYEVTLTEDLGAGGFLGAVQLDVTDDGRYVLYFRGQVDVQLNAPGGDIVTPTAGGCSGCGACELSDAHPYGIPVAGSYVVHISATQPGQSTTTLVVVRDDSGGS